MGEIAQEICAFARQNVGLAADATNKMAALEASAARSLGRKSP
jgi:hypothetical protein